MLFIDLCLSLLKDLINQLGIMQDEVSRERMCHIPVAWVVRLDAGAAQGMDSRLITKTRLWICRRYFSKIPPHPPSLVFGLPLDSMKKV